MRKVQYLLLMTSVLFLSGLLVSCATIISGTSQSVSINSTPDEAKVTIKTTGGNVVFNGTTPTTAQLERKNAYNVTLELSGYQTEQIHLSKGLNGWIVGNIICGGPLGLLIDAINGAMYELQPGQIRINLTQASNPDGTLETYAVLYTMDDDQQIRTRMVPLQPE